MNKMKKFALAMGLGAILVVAAIAGSEVYGRATQALLVTTGAVTWTNSARYAALSLKRIWVQRDLDAASTVTVSRITSDGAYTDAVCTVVAAAGTGSQSTFTAAYLQYGDMLKFVNSTTTGATMVIEYTLQDKN